GKAVHRHGVARLTWRQGDGGESAWARSDQVELSAAGEAASGFGFRVLGFGLIRRVLVPWQYAHFPQIRPKTQNAKRETRNPISLAARLRALKPHRNLRSCPSAPT